MSSVSIPDDLRPCGVALGSNLGDRTAKLSTAKEALRDLHEGADSDFLSSDLYESEPVDCEPDDPLFLNAVIEIWTSHSPVEMLHLLHGLEEKAGRVRKGARVHAPRTLDLDLLYLGEERIDEENLQLPHPRLGERRFVLEPLASIRPALILPGEEGRISDLLDHLPDDDTAIRQLAQSW